MIGRGAIGWESGLLSSGIVSSGIVSSGKLGASGTGSKAGRGGRVKTLSSSGVPRLLG